MRVDYPQERWEIEQLPAVVGATNIPAWPAFMSQQHKCGPPDLELDEFDSQQLRQGLTNYSGIDVISPIQMIS
jgi:hypothetical protein